MTDYQALENEITEFMKRDDTGTGGMLVKAVMLLRNDFAPIADHLRQELEEKASQRTYNVNGYVRGTNKNDEALVWLYSSHPGLGWRVSTVYFERFGELPFDGYAGELCQAELAPSKAHAEKHGLLNKVHEFRVITIPTGSFTDKDEAIYKFSHVEGAERATRELMLEQEEEAKPAVTVQDSVDAAVAAVGPRQTPEDNGDTPTHADIQRNREDNKNPVQKTQKEGEPIVRKGELSPDNLITWFQQNAQRFKARKVTDRQVGYIHAALEKIAPSETARRRLQVWLTGHDSLTKMDQGQLFTLHGWLKPAGMAGATDPYVNDEIAVVLDLLGDPLHQAAAQNTDSLHHELAQGACA